MLTQQQIEALVTFGIDPTTLGDDASCAPVTPTAVNNLSNARISFVPLTDAEWQSIETLFPASANAKIAPRVLLNSLLAHACGVPWQQCAHGDAARLRLIRGIQRRDCDRLHDFVCDHASDFSAERRETFRRLKVIEDQHLSRRL